MMTWEQENKSKKKKEPEIPRPSQLGAASIRSYFSLMCLSREGGKESDIESSFKFSLVFSHLTPRC